MDRKIWGKGGGKEPRNPRGKKKERKKTPKKRHCLKTQKTGTGLAKRGERERNGGKKRGKVPNPWVGGSQ